MTFEEIPLRMHKLGVDRAWLATACRYSKSTLANTLSKNGSNRNERALSTIWEALDREEARQAALASHPPFERQQLVLRPTDREYAAWCREAGGEPLQEWALAALNRAAARYLAGPVPLPAPEAEQQA
jgi:hypothetical protein